MKKNIAPSSTIDPEEIAHFTQMAEDWWKGDGKFAPLHAMNPVRIGFIKQEICRHFGKDAQHTDALNGLTLLDVGCGGGLLCEPLARLGAEVTGVDAGEENIRIASLHAEQQGLNITYRHSSAEHLAYEEKQQFDVVTALEIIEHVADVDAFIHALHALVKPGGMLFISTLNRTAKSYAMAILGAEYILRIMPVGTHHWKKFLRPSEVVIPLENTGLSIAALNGMVYHPVSGKWELHNTDYRMNYILAAIKPSMP